MKFPFVWRTMYDDLRKALARAEEAHATEIKQLTTEQRQWNEHQGMRIADLIRNKDDLSPQLREQTYRADRADTLLRGVATLVAAYAPDDADDDAEESQ